MEGDPGQTIVGIVAAQYHAEPIATGRKPELSPLPHFQAELLQLGHQLYLFAGIGKKPQIAVLDWKDVDLAEKTITVHATKTKARARRIVEISDNLGAWLLPYSAKAGPVAPGRYRQWFEDIRRSAAIDPWPRNAMRHLSRKLPSRRPPA